MSAGSFGKHIIRTRVQLGSKTFYFSPRWLLFCILAVVWFVLSECICMYHTHDTHTHTQAETHLPNGAVVDNSRLSAPEASAGTVVFMLKQQQRRFTRPYPPPVPSAPPSDVPTQDGLHSSTSSTSSLPRLWKSPL